MEEGTFEQPSLEKHYYGNCPGCKVDQAKELRKDVSIRNLSYIWMAVLCGSKHLISVPKFSSGLVLFLFAKVCRTCILAFLFSVLT